MRLAAVALGFQVVAIPRIVRIDRIVRVGRAASIFAMAIMFGVVGCGVPAFASGCIAPEAGELHSRATRYVEDITSRQRWAIIPDRQHPERPATLVEIPGDVVVNAAEAKIAALPKIVIHTGARVLLWRESVTSHAVLDAVALQDGAVGSVISLRLAHGGAVLSGVVRGAGSAELQPAGRIER